MSNRDRCATCKHERGDHFEVTGRRHNCSIQWCECKRFDGPGNAEHVAGRAISLIIGGKIHKLEELNVPKQ